MENDPHRRPEIDLTPDKTEVGTLLDLHYSACSIPAGNASALAHKIVSQESESLPRTVFAVDKSGFKEEFTATHFLHTRITNHPKAQSLQFVLSQSKAGNNSPCLLAVFDSDIAVQVAGFEKRDDDRCNFVQLGQEITDENYIATRNNHARIEYVHAIKNLLSQRYDANDLNLITELTLSEIERIQEEPLDSERLASVHRNLMDKLKKATPRPPAEIHLIDDSHISRQTVIEKSFPEWAQDLELLKGQAVSLAVIQRCAPRSRLGSLMVGGKFRNTPTGDYTLVAKTAPDVAIPLYTFSDKGESVYSELGHAISREEATHLQALISMADGTMLDCIRYEYGAAVSEISPEYLTEEVKKLRNRAEYLRQNAGTLNLRQITEIQKKLWEKHQGQSLKDSSEYLQAKDEKTEEDKLAIAEFSDTASRLEIVLDRVSNIAPSNMPQYNYANSRRPLIGDVIAGVARRQQERSTALTLVDRVAKLEKELEDHRTNPRHAHVAFVQQPAIREKITREVGEPNPVYDIFTNRLRELLDQKDAICLKGIYADYAITQPNSTKHTYTDLEVASEIVFSNGVYTLEVSLIPDGQQGKGEAMILFRGEVSSLYKSKIEGGDEKIKQLIDLLKIF